MPDFALGGTAKVNVILIWVSWHQTISDQQVRALIFGVLDRQQLDKWSVVEPSRLPSSNQETILHGNVIFPSNFVTQNNDSYKDFDLNFPSLTSGGNLAEELPWKRSRGADASLQRLSVCRWHRPAALQDQEPRRVHGKHCK